MLGRPTASAPASEITLYDPQRRIGGLAHTLLPRSPRPAQAVSRPGKFVDPRPSGHDGGTARAGAPSGSGSAPRSSAAPTCSACSMSLPTSISAPATPAPPAKPWPRLGIPLLAEDVGRQLRPHGGVRPGRRAGPGPHRPQRRHAQRCSETPFLRRGSMKRYPLLGLLLVLLLRGPRRPAKHLPT